MTHPTDLELVEFIDDLLTDPRREEVRRHVADCPTCEALVADAGTPIPKSRRPIPMFKKGAAELSAGFESVPGPVAPRNLWRVQWDGVAEMVLVIQVLGDEVEIVPVVFDPLVGDERTVLLEAADSPLLTSAAVWAGLRRRVPLGAFSEQFGAVEQDVFDRLLDERPGGGLGEPIRSSGHPAAAVRARLLLHLARLEGARWVPATASSEPVDVAARLKQAGLRPTELAAQLGMTPAQVTDVLRGRRGLTGKQAEAAAGLLGLETSQLSGNPPIPVGLVIELQQPRWRPQLARKASRSGTTLDDARAGTAQVVLAMAARTTGERRGEPDWALLIGDQLTLP